jgi:hypothetical protein
MVIAGAALPFSRMVCGELGASSVSAIAAERNPVAAGRKVTEMEQFEPAAMVVLQFGAEMLNSFELAPDSAIAEICSATPPEFVTMTLEDELLPRATGVAAEPKVSAPGASVTAGAGATPAFPFSGMLCGESGASSVSRIVAERKPAATGIKLTAIGQLELTAMAELQFGAEKLNSPGLAPETAIAEMCSAIPPEFVTVTLEDVLVPTGIGATTEPKVTLPGTSVTAGDGASPVPASVTVSDGGAALSVIVRDAVRAPVAAGVNVIVTVQD